LHLETAVDRLLNLNPIVEGANMKINRFTSRRAILAVAFVAVCGGCAQTPQTTAAAPSAEAQRRAAFAAHNQRSHARDDFYDRAAGVTRDMPNFQALKHALSGMYSDPVVVDWMEGQLRRGVSQETFVASVSQRAFSGLNRLEDDAALTLFNVMGTMMARLDKSQCDQFLQPAADARSRFGRMVAAMTAEEVQGLFDTFRRALRADISGQPLRAVPAGGSLALVTASLALAQAAAPFESAGGNHCRATAGLLHAVSAMSGDERSSAITIVLATVGMGGAQAVQQRTAEAR
jgi:hypothetical protein